MSSIATTAGKKGNMITNANSAAVKGLTNMICAAIGNGIPLLIVLLASARAHAASSPTKLEFSSPAQTIALGRCAQVSVVTTNSALQPAAVTKIVTVTTDGGGGLAKFFSDSSCKVSSDKFTIPVGQYSGSFYILGSATGPSTIRVSATGLQAQSQTETITAAAGSVASDCAGPQPPPNTLPSQAASAGFYKLVFDDEFNSTATISPDGTGSYNWYTTNWYNSSATLPNSGYTVSNGCLTILTDASGYSDGLATVEPTHTSQVWQHGYFEARIRFNPAGNQGSAWPAFWSYAIEGPQGSSSYAELDFMEAYPSGTSKSTILTTIHQWTGSTSTQQTNDVPTLPSGTDLSQFHTYGCLWTTDQVTWYFDNAPVMTVATGPGTNFTAIEQDHMFLLLGTGKNWPMDVDYVHVWH
jgi:beta-glucanase (GH16 family)